MANIFEEANRLYSAEDNLQKAFYNGAVYLYNTLAEMLVIPIDIDRLFTEGNIFKQYKF